MADPTRLGQTGCESTILSGQLFVCAFHEEKSSIHVKRAVDIPPYENTLFPGMAFQVRGDGTFGPQVSFCL